MSVLTLAFAAAVFSVLSPGQFPVAIADGLPTPAWAFQVSTHSQAGCSGQMLVNEIQQPARGEPLRRIKELHWCRKRCLLNLFSRVKAFKSKRVCCIH